jgi:hypothetical protein
MARKSWTGLLGVMCSAAALFAPGTARAEPPITAGGIQLGLGFRYGFDFEEGDLNPWGTGLGIEGGYTLPSAVYIGANLEYYLGSTVEILGAEVSSNVYQLSAEGGYDLGFAERFVLRPKVGVGLAGVRSKVCPEEGGCDSESSSELLVTPGVAFLFLGERFSFSADVRYAVIFSDPEPLNGVLLTLGIGF